MPSFRETVAGHLVQKDYGRVFGLARDDRRTVRTLMGLLYHDEALVRWRAVTMFGHLAADAPELVSPVVNRLLWFLNEESSTVGWGSAQALSEIARRNPGISEGFVRVVVHFIDDDEVSRPANRNTPILVGAIWSIGNLADCMPGLTREMGPILVTYIDDPEPEVRALVAWALGRTGFRDASERLMSMTGDGSAAEIYVDEYLRTLTVGTAAAEALSLMDAGPANV